MKTSELERSEAKRTTPHAEPFGTALKLRRNPSGRPIAVAKSTAKERLPPAGATPKRSMLSVTAIAAHNQKLQSLALARTRVDTEALRLQNVRGDHHAAADMAVDLRLADTEKAREKIAALAGDDSRNGDVHASVNLRHLHSQAFHSPTHAIGATDLPTDAQPRDAAAEKPRASQSRAVELIEKIDFFLRSKNPALALTLNDASGISAEIEKTGRNTVSITLKSDHRESASATIALIQTELAARGLRISRFCLAAPTRGS